MFHLQQLKFQEFSGKWKIPLTSVSFPKSMPLQRAKKVMSDRRGLLDFAMGLVIFVLNLPNGQVLFFGEIQITEGLINPCNQKGFLG